jgi:hypothetical protein
MSIRRIALFILMLASTVSSHRKKHNTNGVVAFFPLKLWYHGTVRSSPSWPRFGDILLSCRHSLPRPISLFGAFPIHDAVMIYCLGVSPFSRSARGGGLRQGKCRLLVKSLAAFSRCRKLLLSAESTKCRAQRAKLGDDML